MVYNFENYKPFSDFEHVIHKLTYPAKIRPRPCRDLIEMHSGLARDLTGTRSGLDRDLSETHPGPA